MFGSSGLKDKPSPLVMPVLSPGKHRNPRKGACFMEFASYLAGEKWSDRPACTHATLAELARAVNDHIGDATRQTILPMVPDVIGLTSTSPLVELMIARECAIVALPKVPLGRARIIALGLMRCETSLADYDGRPARSLSERARVALESQPLAYAWAFEFCQGRSSAKTLHGISAAAIIDYSVLGVSEAFIDNPDEILVELLRNVIGLCQTWMSVPTDLVPEPEETLPATAPDTSLL